MAKRKTANAQQEPELFDFLDDITGPDDEAMLGVMTGFIEASHHQMEISVELTKLVVQKNNTGSMSEEEIFSTFKRASQVVSDSSALKDVLEKIN